MLYKNFKFLVKKSKRLLKSILTDLNLTNSALTRWKNGGGAHPETLKRIALYFSYILNIPYTLFRDGKALSESDFENILIGYKNDRSLQEVDSAQSLHINDSPQDGHRSVSKERGDPDGFEPTDRKVTEHELDLIAFFRELKHGSKHIPLPESSIKRIMEMCEIIGVDSETHFSFLKFIQDARKRYGPGAIKELGGEEEKGE